MKLNHPRRYLILAAAIAGIAAILHIGDDGVEVYIPRTLLHYKCHFPDGSYTEYKERYKWYFYLEALPVIVNTRGNLDSISKYVDPQGKIDDEGLASDNSDCIGIGKRNGRLFSRSGFENADGQWVAHSSRFNGTEGWGRWEDFPKVLSRHLPKSLGQPFGEAGPPTENQEFLKNEYLSTGNGTYVLPLENDSTFLFEQALTAREHPGSPFRTILYVYQSLSTDNGKTWSPPVITKDAKLFEIGKLITEQSWSAKPEIIVDIIRPR